MTHSLTRTITAFVAALIAALGLCLAGLAPQSSALPPGGAADSSAGTSSTVSSPVEVGGTVEFTLSGFPVGSTVSIKIDDGQGYSDQGTQFTGVVHQGVVPSSGTLSGSFQLPSFVEPGEHWLRFLTSVAVDTDGGGYQGYSNKSPNFTVVEAGSTSGGSNNSSGGSNSGGSGSGSNSGGSQSGSDSDGGVVYVDEEGATITQGATSNGSSSNSGNSSNSSSSSSESDEAGKALGVRVQRTRALSMLAITLLCGAATAAAGPLTFVGLAVLCDGRAPAPHHHRPGGGRGAGNLRHHLPDHLR